MSVTVFLIVDIKNSEYTNLLDSSTGVVDTSKERFFISFQSIVAENKEIKEEEDVTISDTIPSIDKTDLSTGLKQDAINFYEPISYKSNGSDIVSLDGSEAKLYSYIPWDTANAYQLSYEKVEKYISDNLGISGMRSSVAIDNHCGTKLYEVDGVKCVSFAGLPVMSFLDVDENGIANGWSVATRPRKVCAVLEEKATGKIWFLPLHCVPDSKNGDAKGHVFPGGVAQTFLKMNGAWNGSGYTFDDDGGTIKGSIINNPATQISDITREYKNVTYCGKPVFIQYNLELHRNYQTSISKKYNFKAFISWEENKP